MKRWVRCLSCVRPHVCELRLIATERDVETPAVRVWGRSRNHSRHGRQCAISFQEHPMPICMTHRVRKAAQHTHWTYAGPRPRVEGSCEMGWMGEVETETSCARCGKRGDFSWKCSGSVPCREYHQSSAVHLAHQTWNVQRTICTTILLRQNSRHWRTRFSGAIFASAAFLASLGKEARAPRTAGGNIGPAEHKTWRI